MNTAMRACAFLCVPYFMCAFFVNVCILFSARAFIC